MWLPGRPATRTGELRRARRLSGSYPGGVLQRWSGWECHARGIAAALVGEVGGAGVAEGGV